MARTIMVEFIPQAWVRDYAVTVDAEGPTKWPVSERLLRGVKPGSDKADGLRSHRMAPAWVRKWQGPFEITWDEEKTSVTA